MKITTLIFMAFAVLACTPAPEMDSKSENNGVEKSKIQKGKVENLNPDEMSKRMKDHPGTILDVRTPEEWSEGMIEGATTYNFYEDNFADQLRTLPKDQPVYVYCAAGGRSSEAAKVMSEMGFREVYNLDGGIGEWKARGLPTAK